MSTLLVGHQGHHRGEGDDQRLVLSTTIINCSSWVKMGTDQGKDKPYVWTNERIFSVLLVTSVIALIIGSYIGTTLATDTWKPAAEVWEDRAQKYMGESSSLQQLLLNRDATIERLLRELGELPGEQARLIKEHKETLISLNRYEEAYKELQEEYVRLQVSYQTLWDIWWNATH